MKKATARVGLMLMAAVSVNGCFWMGGEDGMFRDRHEDYLSAPIAPPTSVPEHLDSYTLTELYAVPDEPLGADNYYPDAPTPRPLERNVREGVAIQRFGERSWIVVGAAPSQVWPRLRDYWTAAQIELERADAIERVVETAWLENLENDGVVEKFRVSIEPGLHAGSSEIYVSHVSASDDAMVDSSEIDWSQESDNPELEAQMMNSISVYLADRTDLYRASSVSLLAGSVESASKAELTESEDGEPVLQLRIDFARAWAQVGQALEDAGVEVIDSARDSARYEVLFAGTEGMDEEDEGPGFFRRLFTFGEPEEAEARPFNVYLNTTDSAINVTASAAASAQDAVEPGMQERLLRLINENLR